jgi:hypothetical protein
MALLAVLVVAAVGFSVTVALGASGPPTPTLTANPSASPTNSTTMTFTFSSSGATGYQCKLDAGSFGFCSSPKSYSGLAAGSHTFQVYAVDSKGKTSGTTSYAWTIDTTAPTLTSIARLDASPSKATPLRFTLTFSEPVGGVAAGNFTAVTGAGVTGTPTVGTPTPNGGPAPRATWTVPVNTSGVTGTGSNTSTIGLNLTSPSGIKDAANNGLATASLTGGTYVFDTTAPAVASITRAAASPTNASAVSWTVTFNEPVTGVGTGNFSLLQSGLTGSPSVTGVSGSGATWTVTASTGSGTPADGSAGTLQLNLSSVGGIVDLAGNGLSATYAGVGSAYQVDKLVPAPVLTYKPDDPNGDGIANFNWTESEAGATVLCSIENGKFTSCPSEGGYQAHYIVDVANDGTHQFALRASDALGNSSVTSYSWKVLHEVNVVVTGDAVGLLYPDGPTRQIALVLHNPNNFPLTISFIDVSVKSSPPGCPAFADPPNIVIQQSNIGNGPSPQTIVVPANSDLPLSPANRPTIRLVDTGLTQDACQNGAFTLTYLAKGAK